MGVRKKEVKEKYYRIDFYNTYLFIYIFKVLYIILIHISYTILDQTLFFHNVESNPSVYKLNAVIAAGHK